MPQSFAIFSAHYAPHIGGIESFTEHLAHELVREGYKACVITSQLDDASPLRQVQSDGVEVYRLPAHRLLKGRLPISRHNALYRECFEELTHKDFDAVLINARFYQHSIEGLRLAQKMQIPALVLDHGSAYLTFGNPVLDFFVRIYEHLATARVKAYQPRFAGVSKRSAAWLETFGIHTSTVVSNALDAKAYRAQDSGRDFRYELGLSSSDKLVTFVGRLTPEKGADAVVEAAKILGKDYTFALAGDGFMRAQLEQAATKNVHFLGYLSSADTSALLSQSSIFVLPTRSEGCATVLLEAGVWGVPLVTTKTGAAETVLSDGTTSFGELIDTRDGNTVAAALERVLSWWQPHNSSAEINYIEKTFNWSQSVAALQAAFMGE